MRGGGRSPQQTWKFECILRAKVTRTEASSSAFVGEVAAGQTVAVGRIVDSTSQNSRRLFLPEHCGWVDEVDGSDRVLFELREPPLQLDALSTRESLLAFSDGADIAEHRSAQ